MGTTEADIPALLQQFKVVAHPTVPLPSLEELQGLVARGGTAVLAEYLARRDEVIRNMEEDPLHYGYEWPWYGDARWLLDGKGPGARPAFMDAFPSPLAELWVFGGNDTGKSWFSAKWGVEQLRPENMEFDCDFAFCHSTEDSSKNQQQQLVYKHMPPAWRTAGRAGKFIDLSFKGKSGFTDNKFVMRQKRGFFFFYKQEPGVLTGYKLRGATCDELITLVFLEELRARMLGRDGRILGTFTPVDGYTVTVADILAGHTVVEWRPSMYLPGNNMPNLPGSPKGCMPYIVKCRRSNVAAMFVFSEWSPFRKPTEIAKLIEGKPSPFVKMRLYGWAEKQQGVAIPKFSEVHIVKRKGEKPPGPVPPLPWLAPGEREVSGEGAKVARGPSGQAMDPEAGNVPGPEDFATSRATAPYPQLGKVGTNYRVADPGGSKNWVIKWYRFVPIESGRHFVYLYREWPDIQTHGEWALPGDKHDGVPGPAQRSSFGRGIIDYKRLILTLEGWVWNEQEGRWDGSKAEQIQESYIDPRMGGAEVPTVDDGTSIIAMMEEEQRDSKGRLVGPSMIWLQAPGGGGSIANQQGIMLLNDWFDYDTERARNEGVNISNCPTFYVVEDCEQSIYAYRTYTGLDGEKGALKDIMDPDYYLRKADVGHVDAQSLKVRGGGSY